MELELEQIFNNIENGSAGLLVPQDKSSGTNGPTSGVSKKIKKDTRKRDRNGKQNAVTFVHYTFEVGHLVPIVPENDFYFYCHEIGE